MNKLLDSCGGRKMFVFLIVFISITTFFAFDKDVSQYAIALSPFVGLLTIGNLGEHKIKKGQE